MRKLLLSLLICCSITVTAQKTDNYNRILFKEVKKNKATSEEIRDFLVETYKGIEEKTNDEDLKKDIKSEIEILESLKFPSVKAKDLKNIDSKLLKKYRVVKDDFNKSVNIYNKSHSDGFAGLSLFISSKDKMSLRFSAQYHGSNWVFFKYYSVLCGDERYDFTFEETDRDVKLGNVYERGSIFLQESEITAIRKILEYEGDIKIRFTGEKYADFKLPKVQINRMKEIIQLYDELKDE